MTRLTYTEADLGPRAPESDAFTGDIIEFVVSSFATLVGLREDREVFTTEGLEKDPQLKKVVQKHLRLSEDLKAAYKDATDMSGPEFKAWGWIMTDYFPDLFDAKQLTITTYV